MTHKLDSIAARHHRWKVLGLGVAANACLSAIFQGIPTTAVLMRSGYQLGTAQLGLALGLMGLGIALSELPWGLLTDRWGDRRVLLIGLSTTAAALLAMALFAAPSAGHVPRLPALAGGLIVVGLLGGSVNGASGRAVMGWFREGERGLAMSIRQTAIPLGGGLGALVLPPVAAHGGFVAVYGVLAAACAISFGFAWRWLHEPPADAASAPVATLDDAKPLRDARLWRIAAGIGLLCVPQVAVLSFATVFLHDFGHRSAATITAALAAVQIGAMAMRVWSGRFTDRHHNRPLYLRVCSIASIGAFVLLGLLSTDGHDGWAMSAMLLTLVLAGICVSAWHGVAYTELATLAGTAQSGTALGMANTAVFLSFFITPIAIPALLTVGSWPMVWLVSACFAGIAWPFFPRPPKKRALLVMAAGRSARVRADMSPVREPHGRGRPGPASRRCPSRTARTGRK